MRSVTTYLQDKGSIIKRLDRDKYILQPEGCWLWAGYCLDGGHGQMQIEGKTYLVHRISLYVYSNFDLNGELDALHKRECKRKNCFNPEHLYAGTDYDNQRDTVALKTHVSSKKTHCPQGHPYSEENTGDSCGRRRCKTCARLYSRLKSK